MTEVSPPLRGIMTAAVFELQLANDANFHFIEFAQVADSIDVRWITRSGEPYAIGSRSLILRRP
jgi:hypothetical protein